MVWLTDRPDMTSDVYRGRKTTIQYNTGMNSGPLYKCSNKVFYCSFAIQVRKRGQSSRPICSSCGMNSRNILEETSNAKSELVLLEWTPRLCLCFVVYDMRLVNTFIPPCMVS